jgi:3-phenylpropionate/cinnamic acid dioxygenase small subunit
VQRLSAFLLRNCDEQPLELLGWHHEAVLLDLDEAPALASETLPSERKIGVTVTDLDSNLQRLIDESDIRALMYRYCRSIDRREMDDVRACYHPEAFCHHGSFAGDLDGFVTFADQGLATFSSTMHFVGNIAIEIDGDRARSETYCIAFHHLPARGSKPTDRDYVVGLRYVDDLVRYHAGWRILDRVCVFEWTRTDPVPSGWSFRDGFVRGRRDGHDLVYSDPPLRERVGTEQPGILTDGST